MNSYLPQNIPLEELSNIFRELDYKIIPSCDVSHSLDGFALNDFLAVRKYREKSGGVVPDSGYQFSRMQGGYCIEANADGFRVVYELVDGAETINALWEKLFLRIAAFKFIRDTWGYEEHSYSDYCMIERDGLGTLMAHANYHCPNSIVTLSYKKVAYSHFTDFFEKYGHSALMGGRSFEEAFQLFYGSGLDD